ncbi:MAG: 6-bladed beta-propeller [Vicinamibacterales bacterium]
MLRAGRLARWMGMGAALVALASAQARTQGMKGGEDETGPYRVVEGWPRPWSAEGYIWGSQPAVFAESSNRIFIGARGELELPETLPRGFNGIWGSLGQRATEPTAVVRNCIVVVDGDGRLLQAWTQWDHLFEGSGPHKIRISPYDPEKHVWVVNDGKHVIHEFTNDGSRLVRTLGEMGVAGDDGGHFGMPQDVAFLPDGSILVADGLRNARIARFDRAGRFVGAFGTRGDGPGQLSGVHGIAVDRGGRIYVADRSNHRVQVFDEQGTVLDVWPGLRQPNDIVVGADDRVWVVDGTNARLLQFDREGRRLYWWGTWGVQPGQFWEPHQVSVDEQGTCVADSFGGRTQSAPDPSADATRRLVAQRSASAPRER